MENNFGRCFSVIFLQYSICFYNMWHSLWTIFFYAYISCFLPEAASLYKFGIKSPETAKTGRQSKEYHPNA